MAKDSILEALIKSGIRAATPVMTRAAAQQVVRHSPKLNPDHPLAPQVGSSSAKQLRNVTPATLPPATASSFRAGGSPLEVLGQHFACVFPHLTVAICEPPRRGTFAALVQQGQVVSGRMLVGGEAPPNGWVAYDLLDASGEAWTFS